MFRYLNIACGSSYISDGHWENVDYLPGNDSVRQQNILGGLQTTQSQYEAVYCSHFVEHVPVDLVHSFLLRCRALTRKGGLFRVVVPDAEMLVREYQTHRQTADHEKADFAYAVFLDQCVRRRSGGELSRWCGLIESGDLGHLRDYAEYLLGREHLLDKRELAAPQAAAPTALSSALARRHRLWSRIESGYIRAVCGLLPTAFRTQNVSLAGVGERHMWMYDFHSLTEALRNAGFDEVHRVTYQTTGRGDGLFAPLDEIEGAPRKGHHQLFVEARV